MNKEKEKKKNKRVILVIVDALNSRTFFPALESGRLPNFQHLVEGGTVRRRSFSIFPSLTPAATSTIITGAAPREHRVFGFHWFDRSNNEAAYYGDDFWTIAEMGFAEFFDGCLCRLNQDRLSAPTIFQKLHQLKIESACLNFLMYKGEVEHVARVPLWFSWHPDVPFAENIKGPEILYFGDFVDSSYQVADEAPSRKSGLFGRFGFNDENTGSVLAFLGEHDRLPAFTLAYFPDHDYDCHDNGPEKGAQALLKVDETLGEFFELYGGPRKALEQFTFVVTGDHSQSDIVDDTERATIKASSLFEGFTFSNVSGWEEEEVLKVFPDMRCAQVYLKDPGDTALRDAVIARLLEEERVDQVLWKAGKEYFVKRAGSDILSFEEAGEGCRARDRFGGGWNWEGDLSCVDGTEEDGRIEFGEYPNAFERIVGALDHQDSGNIWVTSRLGYEFANTESEVHVGGGSHGSLHREDSESPLLISGVQLDLPEVTRLTDVEPICLQLLGVPVEKRSPTSIYA